MSPAYSWSLSLLRTFLFRLLHGHGSYNGNLCLRLASFQSPCIFVKHNPDVFVKHQKRVVLSTSQVLQERTSSRLSAMPKKDKTSKSTQKQAETTTGPVSRLQSGEVIISVHAKPGSKQNAITDVSAEAVGVAIAAPPTDGEANAELVRYFAKVLELKKSEVVLDKGCRSRGKVIKVSGTLSPEEVLEKLKQEASR
ncbi:UPF0235 protein C15orf40 homolog [Chanos chanos]|uniref:UPF0235 protein C15orf40 homolog n=1 Tax=Chanos chanos TaxID=29144 RepID=A0A6J2UQ52_CHACN|nr:UPF0235 protein C15orf40 homolog [Chanos chanos]